MQKFLKYFLLKFIFLGPLHFLSTAQSDQKDEAPFKPNKESFHQYKYTEWFRDAKFGIWAHWGHRRFRARTIGMPGKCTRKAVMIALCLLPWRTDIRYKH